MKKHFMIFTVLSASTIYAQEGRVGINTSTPNATLDVTASPTDLTRTDGFIAPRLKGAELKNKDSNYTSDQTGAIVYVTEALASADTTAKTINVTSVGYYYFDGTVWVKMVAGGIDKTDDEWINDSANTRIHLGKKSDGTTARDAGTEFVVLDNGRVGIGTTTPLSHSKLHIVDEKGIDDFVIESYGLTTLGNTGNPQIMTKTARGTYASPENLQSGDVIGTLSWQSRFNNQFGYSNFIQNIYKGNGTTNLSSMTFYISNGLAMTIDENRRLGIGTLAPTSKLQVVGLQEFVDNAAAIAGGLTVGAFYRTGDLLKVVH